MDRRICYVEPRCGTSMDHSQTIQLDTTCNMTCMSHPSLIYAVSWMPMGAQDDQAGKRSSISIVRAAWRIALMIIHAFHAFHAFHASFVSYGHDRNMIGTSDSDLFINFGIAWPYIQVAGLLYRQKSSALLHAVLRYLRCVFLRIGMSLAGGGGHSLMVEQKKIPPPGWGPKDVTQLSCLAVSNLS